MEGRQIKCVGLVLFGELITKWGVVGGKKTCYIMNKIFIKLTFDYCTQFFYFQSITYLVLLHDS